MSLRTTNSFLLTVLLASCGQPDNSQLVSDLSKSQLPSSEMKSDEKSLSLSSMNGFQFGSSVTGARAGIGKAFRSFVNYQNGSGRRCSGFLAYDDVVDGSASVYFYTASHCFEKRTPLGKRIASNVAVNNPKSYLSPWLEANAVTRSLSVASPQILRYNDGRNSDVIRFFQFRSSLTGDAGTYLPLCYMSDFDGHQVVGYTSPKQTTNRGVVWANTLTSPPDLPKGFIELLSLVNNNTIFRRATGVTTSPGDSGSPVYGVKRFADGVGVDSYQCVFGIITRELWVNQGCSGGACKMRGESVYERVRNNDFVNGKWEPYVPPLL